MASRLDETSSVASNPSSRLESGSETLSDLLQLSNDAFVWLDLDGRIVRVSDRMEVLSARSRTELLGSEFTSLVRGVSEFEDISNWRLGDIREGKVELRCPSGGVRIARYRARASQTDILVVLDDLTERIEALSARESAEKRLAVAAETLARVVEAAPVVIDSLDLDANVQFWNPAAEELFGWTAEEVVGGPPPGITDSALEQIREEVREARSFSRKPVQRRTRDGRLLELSLSSAPLTDENGDVVGSVGILVDETDKRATAEALNQAQKMEAVGRLAGGVAHDFNNMLSAIMGFARLVHAELDEGSAIRDDVEEIIIASERANRLTEQLLTFSRRRVTRKDVFDLHGRLEGMQRMIERLVGEDVVVRSDFAAVRSTVAMDPSHLEQVVMNLVVNARDAMPDGGKLTLSTAMVAKEHCPNATCEGACVVLIVRDNGIGMDEETRKKVFDPFFTTKEDGSGIGMSTVYGILKQHKAHIDIQSEVGVGTMIRISFPLADDVELTARESTTTLETLNSTSGEILVVDDERAVREYVEKVLSRHGYQVVIASNAGEAFLLCDEQPDRFQVVLTDMVMPRVDGVSLYERLRAVAPATDVLFMSGFPATSAVDMPEDIELLKKPFAPDELLAFVGRALERRKE